jgi:hypothetical protein
MIALTDLGYRWFRQSQVLHLDRRRSRNFEESAGLELDNNIRYRKHGSTKLSSLAELHQQRCVDIRPPPRIPQKNLDATSI